MTPQVRARIFEPFFTTKSAGKGTGLGLAVVQGIVKQSAGHIAVHSEPGAGTIFKIYFPAARGRSSRPRRERRKTHARGCETVLWVEDEDALRNLGSVVLETYGYTVLTAANGQEALRLVERRTEKLDLLLTDVVMPGISGCELASALRNLQPDLKVLFLSGYTEDTILHRGIPKDGTAFLNKPFSPASLTTKVRQVLDGK
jgi:CheY-like chemotaxis protein